MMNGITIQVSKDVLLKTLQTNHDKHAKEYDKAKRGWVKLFRKELVDKLATLDAGGKLELHITNQKPESHLDDYAEAIEMVGFHAHPTIELDQQEFRQFMKDDWNWKRLWAASNSTYIASG